MAKAILLTIASSRALPEYDVPGVETVLLTQNILTVRAVTSPVDSDVHAMVEYLNGVSGNITNLFVEEEAGFFATADNGLVPLSVQESTGTSSYAFSTIYFQASRITKSVAYTSPSDAGVLSFFLFDYGSSQASKRFFVEEAVADIVTAIEATDTAGSEPGGGTTNASDLTSGTLANARLTADVVLKDATQTLTAKTFTSPVINSPTGIVKGDVGLGNVDNTSDASKPVSTAQQTALDVLTTSVTAINTRLQTETQTYLARVVAAGGTIDSGTLDAIDRFIVRGKNEGWFSAIKQLWIPVGNFVASKIFVVTPSGVTPVFNNFVAADYSQQKGYTLATNANKYIDTGLIPDNNGMASNNLHFALSFPGDVTYDSLAFLMGCTPSNTAQVPYPNYNAYLGQAKVTSSINFICSFAGEGNNFVTHFGSTTAGSAQNGVEANTWTTSGSQAMDSAITLFRSQRENTLTYYSPGSIGFWCMGTDISNALCALMGKAISDLMIEVGVSTYKRQPMVVLGDSIAHGASISSGTNAKIRFPKKLAQKLGMREVNCGIGGGQLSASEVTFHTISGLLRYPGLTDASQGLVALVLGTNDMGIDGATSGTQGSANTYSTNYSTTIAGILALNKQVIVGSPPWRSATTDATKRNMYTLAAAAAAKANKVPFADLMNCFEDTGAASGYFSDGIHPAAAAGHLLIAEALYVASLHQLVRKPTLDFGSISANSQADLTVTVYNAEVGMSVSLGLPAALEAGLVANAFVSAADTVTVRLTNTTGSSIDPASAVYKVTVFLNY